jgi:hypothetical protein
MNLKLISKNTILELSKTEIKHIAGGKIPATATARHKEIPQQCYDVLDQATGTTYKICTK